MFLLLAFSESATYATFREYASIAAESAKTPIPICAFSSTDGFLDWERKVSVLIGATGRPGFGKP
jgi:hypothetical protein